MLTAEPAATHATAAARLTRSFLISDIDFGGGNFDPEGDKGILAGIYRIYH